MYERIVVPLDGSELAELALPAAAELARLSGAPIHLIRVVDITRLERYGAYGLAVEYAGVEAVVEDERRFAGEYLTGVAERLRARRSDGDDRDRARARPEGPDGRDEAGRHLGDGLARPDRSLPLVPGQRRRGDRPSRHGPGLADPRDQGGRSGAR